MDHSKNSMNDTSIIVKEVKYLKDVAAAGRSIGCTYSKFLQPLVTLGIQGK